MFRISQFARSLLVVVLLLLAFGVPIAPVAADTDDVEFFEGFEGQTVGLPPSGWIPFGLPSGAGGPIGPPDPSNAFAVDDAEALSGLRSMRVEYRGVNLGYGFFRPIQATLGPPIEFVWNEKHTPSIGSAGTQHFITLVTGPDCEATASATCRALQISIAPAGGEAVWVNTMYNGEWVQQVYKESPFSGGYEWKEFRVVWGSDNLVHVYIDGELFAGNLPIDPDVTFDAIRWLAGSRVHEGDFWFDDIQIILLDDDLDDDDPDDDELDDDEPDDDELDDD